MAARHLVTPCDDTRTVLYRAGLWRDATTLLVGMGSCNISVGTSDEGIPNTSFSKQGHRYGAVCQLSHDGPELTASAGRFEVKGRQVIGRADGERLSATTLPLTRVNEKQIRHVLRQCEHLGAWFKLWYCRKKATHTRRIV
jgi:hypothetical protein